MSVSTQWIDLPAADGNFGAYLAVPHVGKGAGIVLIQEIFGVNEHIRSVAEQYAADGYVVLVPDLFWRSAPRIELKYEGDDLQRANALHRAIDKDQALADIAATAKVLRGLPQVEGKLGVVGYCFGGLMAYQAAAAGLVDVAVAYYGGGIQGQLDKAAAITVPLQMHFGGADSHIPPQAVQSIAEAFQTNEQVEVHVYPGADHGFNCAHRGSYNQRAAAQAHGNTLLFLSENL